MRLGVAFVVGFICAVSCLADSNETSKQTNIDKLKEKLLTGYNRNNRPENNEKATACDLGLSIIHLDLDETRGVLTSHAWLKMNWTDSKISWDNNSYGIADLHFGADELWQPDLSVYNSAEPGIVEHYAKTNKIAYPNGMILWVPTAKIQTYCAMNLKLWPFDVQKCSIKIGSWTYSGHKINLQIRDFDIDTSEYFQENSEWKILKTSVERNSKTYPCCPEPYPDITFYMTLQRRSSMFKAIVITPAIVVVFITLVSFWLPPQAGEKLLLNGVACVVICILLVYFSQLLPVLAATPPLIVTFYSHTLYLLCASFVISVIVINLSRNRKQNPVPHSIKSNILDGFIGKTLGGRRESESSEENRVEELREVPFEEHKSSNDHIIQTSTNIKAASNHADWTRLAVVIDRATFFIYVFIFIVMGFLHFI